jgi:hypothetical protein
LIGIGLRELVIDTLIRSILSGLLTPRAEAEDKVGLSRLQFSTQEVHEYLETKIPAQTGVTLRAVGGVESLGSRAKLTYKYKHKTPLFEKGAVEDFLSSVLAKTTKPRGFRDIELKSFSST